MSTGFATEVKQTSVGVAEVLDLHNLFGRGIRTPSELTGSNKTLSREELDEKYPDAKAYLKTVGGLAEYLKRYGSGIAAEEYAIRVHHVNAIKQILNIASRLQFIHVLNGIYRAYLDENIGWSTVRVENKFQDKELVGQEVYIGDTLLDLSKPVRIQAVDWNGELVDGLQLINVNKGKEHKQLLLDEHGMPQLDAMGERVYKVTNHTVNVAVQITDDSLSKKEYLDLAMERNGKNQTNIQETLLFSPLDYIVVRIADDEKDEEAGIYPTSFQTRVFLEVDCIHDVPMLECLDRLEQIEQLKVAGKFENAKEFAYLNLFRWGAIDLHQWQRGSEIVDALNKDKKSHIPDTTPIDIRVVQWATNIIDGLNEDLQPNQNRIDESSIVAGALLSKSLAVLSQSYFIFRALVVDTMYEDDIDFRDTYIAVRSKKEYTRQFQSIGRLTTDVYKVIECDRDGNLIRVLDPVDVFAYVNVAVKAVVVKLEASSETASEEATASKEHLDYYNAISSFE